jgi:hypothetical protein
MTLAGCRYENGAELRLGNPESCKPGSRVDMTNLLTWAKNAIYQYGHWGSMTAMSNGEMAERPEETSTTHMTGMRFTKYPVETLVMTAMTRAGRMRTEASSAVKPWTC